MCGGNGGGTVLGMVDGDADATETGEAANTEDGLADSRVEGLEESSEGTT